MNCQECGKTLTNKEDGYGHDCEVQTLSRTIVKDVTFDSPIKEWAFMIKEIHSGRITEISESVYWYFLEVLPPIRMLDYGFVFREGDEGFADTLIFKKQGDKFYCKRSDLK